jgi:uncharacterized protein (DUF2147 family)
MRIGRNPRKAGAIVTQLFLACGLGRRRVEIAQYFAERPLGTCCRWTRLAAISDRHFQKKFQHEAQMNALRISLGALLAVLAVTPALAADNQVQGAWLVPDGLSKVTIAPCAGAANQMCGSVSWIKLPAHQADKDTKNPDPALRGRSILGLQIMSGLKPAGPGKWANGKIYDPQSGKTYNSKIALTGANSLKVEGCVMMVCQPQTWTR